MKKPDKIRKFEVVDFLGNGNFGFVFQAYDPLLKADRAIKLIQVPKPEKFVEAVKEAQTLEACRHKHIVDVKEVDVFFYEGIPCVYIAMEYLAKGSIQKHLENRFISIQDALRIVSEALLGLEHAHNNNVLHRDIKPGNILFGDNGEAKLSDFGLALDYHVDPSDTMGYRPHQPLEVIECNPMDKLSDIYAMGITLFRLINNIPEIKFNFSTMAEWHAAVKANRYPERNYQPHVPRKIKTVVNKAINNDPKKRFQSASEFRQAIEKIVISIDWRPIDDNTWVGADLNGDSYEIIKQRKKSGWTIEYKRNGRRVKENCQRELSDAQAISEFFKMISI
ncbi:serine/threonine-protein kinase [Morganella morganii]|uniref:serine/threonine-protein kinase n=1 Tax=Morganella morganii TaxID=582 RepID=UPI001BD970CD|nr:serine/threonine-protein kinase [Morganella morganii]ELA8730077.1 serine/threonine protein kinase [Morganella morganii]ELB1851500.1 serine/threonine protein kinase [Morganella morganii]MBT0402899.1 serine/threonine protein kinase [Morganella morganii subsp. morganii]MBT0491978.1 serine/threonine protein kinase [Morganella morganii subsp. morganii]MBT0495488.1 serine/threonine protein kinase [Morganella morganii subsp. morganii]